MPTTSINGRLPIRSASLPQNISISKLYQIRYDKPLLLSSGRDVPAERLYKIVRVDQKGGIKPGFGISTKSQAVIEPYHAHIDVQVTQQVEVKEGSAEVNRKAPQRLSGSGCR
jgi:hypothetical protein